ncbi:hypothetical protein AMTRI_Chr08g166330 [Amborella trichopoda]
MAKATSNFTTFFPLISSPLTLVQGLLESTKELASMDKLHHLQVRNSSAMIRKAKLLQPLFEDLKETPAPLPPSSFLCFRELIDAIRKAKKLINECKSGSRVWNLIQIEPISSRFHGLTRDLGRALDILPLSLLPISSDTREQVELLHRHARRAELFIDPQSSYLRLELLKVANNFHSKLNPDIQKVAEIMEKIGASGPSDYESEIQRLEVEIKNQAGTGGLVVISKLNNLISLINHCKFAIFSTMTEIHLNSGKKGETLQRIESFSGSSLVIPDEFKCPISLDLMRDPVIVASGHTYDRPAIAEWINFGHPTCPKSGQKLLHMALIPNFALRSLIHQWCSDNNVFIDQREEEKDLPASGDHITATKRAAEAAEMAAAFLVGKLATGSTDTQRQAALELRLLAKAGMHNRHAIAEAGAIPFLTSLLSSHDSRTQEHAVTALLNLSINSVNRDLIVDAGGVGPTVEVLMHGLCTEARENAAAALFSLSASPAGRAAVGAHPKAVSGLVALLQDGTPGGKRDAATALHNLAACGTTRARIVNAGAVGVLTSLLVDERAGVTDEVLGLLSVLVWSGEGAKEVTEGGIEAVVELVRVGSEKGREYAVGVLAGLCRVEDGVGERVGRRLMEDARSVLALQRVVVGGTPRARRKAEAVMRFLGRYCSQSQGR